MLNKRRQAEKRGRRAESFAVLFLRLKGYKILEIRYKTAQGEIDIIARKKKLLIIIEVKSRESFEEAERALYPSALARIENASEIYIARNQFVQNLGVRFDTIFVLKNFKIIHRKNAWRPS